MITLAVTVGEETRIYPVIVNMTRVNSGSWDDWQDELGPWMSVEDSDECHIFSNIDAEHVSYLYHDGYDNMTACDYANGDRYELRINGVADHDAIVDFFKGGFGARVPA